MNKYLATSLMIIAYFIGIGVGFFLTPEYTAMQQNKNSQMMTLGTPDRNLDLRYLNGMIAHHMSAIYMSEQALQNSQRGEIRELAHAIIRTDKSSIESLYSLRAQLYGRSDKITDFQKVNLGGNDQAFDLRFINALLIHHEEAITVAKELQTKSYRTETLALADDVISSLSSSMNTLKAWRGDWYGI